MEIGAFALTIRSISFLIRSVCQLGAFQYFEYSLKISYFIVEYRILDSTVSSWQKQKMMMMMFQLFDLFLHLFRRLPLAVVVIVDGSLLLASQLKRPALKNEAERGIHVVRAPFCENELIISERKKKENRLKVVPWQSFHNKVGYIDRGTQQAQYLQYS